MQQCRSSGFALNVAQGLRSRQPAGAPSKTVAIPGAHLQTTIDSREGKSFCLDRNYSKKPTLRPKHAIVPEKFPRIRALQDVFV
jgi:hypothetical protein